MRKYSVHILFVILIIISLGCEKKKEPCPILFPLNADTKLNFISYVTNRQNEILYPFEYFERSYIYTDSVGAHMIHYYIERNKLLAFFTDDSCTIWNQVKIDLSAFAVSFGFTYQDSVSFSYWKPVIKINEGIGTTWNLKVDTTFSVIDGSGKEHILKYDFSGNAKYQGWSKVIVPENRTKTLTVQHVQWSRIKHFLYDQTTGDSLIVQDGVASDYFEPELGLVRSIVDYTVTGKDKPKTFQKSTWELYSKLIL